MSDMLRQQLLRPGPLHILVSRPCVFEVRVWKRDESMGLTLTYSSNGIGLIIVDISAGDVRRDAPQVRIGDRIIGVNGIQDSPEFLLVAMLRAGQGMVLQMSRPFG